MKEVRQPKKRISISLDQATFDIATKVATNSGHSLQRYTSLLLRKHLAEVCNAEPLESGEQQKK